ncbi:MAG: tRNA (N(6)-L-threonylcarbamoyladenosine(37)-C(2))-methylthiotransferase MtaB [Candidatus Paraimprobicoccus trichonymphae]|uniref:tRNA (N(6)-L-threonylcarbamoyladenosine(37)-C(2) )-methylthiotransferase MtaB n=1 Tax=Candidatus Paraimprobicoccus trichonymphae TaxID=3033793 RepID=A0AA48I3S1_9FIRM|nr:MAG: tRNA (N(6)-L-threonylcarbamoyladenosine(37)-C(2))-methylthiotransferase MtaB [Candidatus Paraimprobicoccus trichonymphae]
MIIICDILKIYTLLNAGMYRKHIYNFQYFLYNYQIMNFFIITLGCKVNQCESDSIAQVLINNNYNISENLANSDIVILNSCTVTSESDRKTKQIIRKIKRLNQDCILVLTGCMTTTENISDFVDVLVDNRDKKNIHEKILKFLISGEKNFVLKNEFNVDIFDYLPICSSIKTHTRAFLKIQDGCNKFCSYCIVPYVRAKSRSKNLDSVYQDSLKLAKLNYKEIVLTGVNLAAYGLDINTNLIEVIKKISNIDQIKRLRLSSLGPEFFTKNNIEKLSEFEKLCPHFHISLQSGSNKILKLMNRSYTKEFYLKAVEEIYKKIPNSTLTTDMIVGFPNETNEDFLESLKTIQEAGFLKVHIFQYSQRKGTRASNFKNQISKEIKSERTKKMFEVSRFEREKIMKLYKNKEMLVLFEKKSDEEIYEGYSENYIPTKIKSKKDICGKIIKTKL